MRPVSLWKRLRRLSLRCEPFLACSRHGMCWTHSEWAEPDNDALREWMENPANAAALARWNGLLDQMEKEMTERKPQDSVGLYPRKLSFDEGWAAQSRSLCESLERSPEGFGIGQGGLFFHALGIVGALRRSFELGRERARSEGDVIVQGRIREEEIGEEALCVMTNEELTELENISQAEWDEMDAQVWSPGCARPAPAVVCAVCGSWHSPCTPDPERTKQGCDCAASTFVRDGRVYLTGHYGSAVADMTVYRLVDDPYLEAVLTRRGPVDPPGPRVGVDPVCDGCILGLISRGKLEDVGDGELPSL